MLTETLNANVLRSLVGILGSAAMTIVVFYGAVGPDPREDSWTAATVQVESSVVDSIAA